MEKIATDFLMCSTYFFVDITEKANLTGLIQTLRTKQGLKSFEPLFFDTSESTIYHSEHKHYSL